GHPSAEPAWPLDVLRGRQRPGRSDAVSRIRSAGPYSEDTAWQRDVQGDDLPRAATGLPTREGARPLQYPRQNPGACPHGHQGAGVMDLQWRREAGEAPSDVIAIRKEREDVSWWKSTGVKAHERQTLEAKVRRGLLTAWWLYEAYDSNT